ncbi:deoxyuridine triphosphatase [Arthrobacter phage Savage2526]|uniref:dUTP diphosphatase n=8 Tax=Korravirus TaxID=1982076 RepID=A0A0U4JGI7_9CAUD|nr:dUTPase [Arthrobacter phage Glenn]YP_010050588.1 dUTPase [Arthrobacter phage Wawa]ALY10072.1 deoxyuridine triphosphatase [Arthrobacter phage RAP15]ATW58981.1 deoxyuridine triphosphatase [Arthrobacter phage MeganNoll]AZF97428.1 deoxyuridine triphosphatase [Arthrobacter phage Carpal]AZS09744.1 deoxyuridine triphosphatase [Arthrobacter phage Riverdale]AZS10167.1 deoxyuridine triphosphatase [Arthrobacter phage Savage2526]QCG76999.1 deoxyuridine triphosphatase [Arthrobacter phage Scuttle]
MTKTLYLAYPIDFSGGHPVTKEIANTVAWAKREVLGDSGILAYDPGAAWSVGGRRKVTPELQKINQAAIQQSDSMLAYAPAGVRSWGVPAEVERAALRGMNVAIITDGNPSWAMPTGPNVKVVQTKTDGVYPWQFATIEAMDWLADQKLPSFAKGNPARERKTLQFAPVDGAEVQLPTRAYSDDAGLDLFVTEDTWVPANGFVDIRSHIKVQLPDWSWGFLVGRSSTLRKKGLLVNPGIIDAGYRGELFSGVQNMTSKPVHVEAGERIAQLIIIGNGTRQIEPVLVPELNSHARGKNGFGSSGK